MHPQPRVRMKKARKQSHHRFTGNDPAFPARMVLTVSFVLSSVSRAFLPPSPLEIICSTSLISASGYQDHTTSPSASIPLVWQHRRVHRIPHSTSVTIAIRPSCEAGRLQSLILCLANREAKYFSERDWTGGIRLNGKVKLVFRRRAQSSVIRHISLS